MTKKMTGFDHPEYEVLRRVGSGGQAVVYLARHRTIQREVAVKVLRTGHDASMARRILQDARLVARLRHPHIVEIHDAGTIDDTVPYIVMEYVRGRPLGVWASEQERSASDVLEVIRQVASALAEAHRAGVIHRDVKPQNILMVDGSGPDTPPFSAKLLDFGVARPEDSSETAIGMVIGTVGYMAPESYEGQTVPASDVFALGVLLFRLLSGERGIRASTIRERTQHGADAPLGPGLRRRRLRLSPLRREDDGSGRRAARTWDPRCPERPPRGGQSATG